jgi:short-subunit dehydrogenase
MINSKEKKVAAVLGSADGLGKSLAWELARVGYDLLLFDFQKEALKTTSINIKKEQGVAVSPYTIDLSKPEKWEEVTDLLDKSKVHLVVFNAAYGPVKRFEDYDKMELSNSINLNCGMPSFIIHDLILRHNSESKLSIILVSSLSAYYGTKFIAPYSAAKAFLLNFGEALHHEMKNQNVEVMVCLPGAMNTPGFRSSNPVLSKFAPNPQNPDHVAKEILQNLGRKPTYITGRINRLCYFVLTRLLSRKYASLFVSTIMNSMYAKSISSSNEPTIKTK